MALPAISPPLLALGRLADIVLEARPEDRGVLADIAALGTVVRRAGVLGNPWEMLENPDFRALYELYRCFYPVDKEA